MFMHTITIYHHEVVNGADTYKMQVLSGFYWYGDKSIAINGKGVEGSENTAIIASPDMAAEYNKSWSVSKGDRIIKGTGTAIESFKELGESVTVMSIEENVIGSPVDNVKIVGK